MVFTNNKEGNKDGMMEAHTIFFHFMYNFKMVYSDIYLIKIKLIISKKEGEGEGWISYYKRS